MCNLLIRYPGIADLLCNSVFIYVSTRCRATVYNSPASLICFVILFLFMFQRDAGLRYIIPRHRSGSKFRNGFCSVAMPGYKGLSFQSFGTAYNLTQLFCNRCLSRLIACERQSIYQLRCVIGRVAHRVHPD